MHKLAALNALSDYLVNYLKNEMKLGMEYSHEGHGLNWRGEMEVDKIIFYYIQILNCQNKRNLKELQNYNFKNKESHMVPEEKKKETTQ